MHFTETDANPFFTRDLLRHVDIKTTGIYAKVSVEIKKAALDRLNNSEQDPLPIQADDKSWDADQMLRKNRTMSLYQEGCPLSYAQQMLGHESISTTSDFYTFVALDTLAEAMERTSPEKENADHPSHPR